MTHTNKMQNYLHMCQNCCTFAACLLKERSYRYVVASFGYVSLRAHSVPLRRQKPLSHKQTACGLTDNDIPIASPLPKRTTPYINYQLPITNYQLPITIRLPTPTPATTTAVCFVTMTTLFRPCRSSSTPRTPARTITISSGACTAIWALSATLPTSSRFPTTCTPALPTCSSEAEIPYYIITD